MSHLPVTLAAEEPMPTTETLCVIDVLLENFSNVHNELLIVGKEIKLSKYKYCPIGLYIRVYPTYSPINIDINSSRIILLTQYESRHFKKLWFSIYS